MKKSLTKRMRIKARKDIAMLFASPLQIKSRGMKLLTKINNLEYSRFFITLTRKYGNSIERNKAKRIMREVFRLQQEHIKKGYDIGFILFPSNAEGSFKQRNDEVFFCLKKAQLLIIS